MKIVENTDEKLVLSSRPWFIAGFVWFGGLGLVGNGVFAWGEDMDTIGMRLFSVSIGLLFCWLAWRFMPFISVEFNRARGQMLHQSHRLIKPGWFTLELDRIKRARLEASWGDTARMTRIVLEIEGDVVPLEYGYGAKDHDDVVDAINEWLTRPI